MVIKQGDLVWVDLPPVRGSEPAGRRPAVIVQANALNLSRINTAIVAVVTSNLKYEKFPGNVRLMKGDAGIPKSSVVNLSQVHSIDRSYITSKIGSLPAKKLLAVKRGLALILDLNSD